MKTLTNLLLGLAGGVAGLAAMGGVTKALAGDHYGPAEPATEALARTLYEKATHRYPSDRRNRNGGQAIHYSFGLLMAAGYGLVRGRRGGVDLPGGLAFAIGLWASSAMPVGKLI